MPYSKSELIALSRSDSIIRLLSRRRPNFKEVLLETKYWDALRNYQIELIKMQNWIVQTNQRLLVIFEGGEMSGKGNMIRTIAEHLNPRSARSIALPKPSESEEGQWYFQRYINQFPDPGEIVFFDRSWYNRAVVEPVNQFCTKKQYKRFMKEVNNFETMLYNDGLLFIKIYLTISKIEQARRIEVIKNDPLNRWQLTKVDRNAQKLWVKFKSYEKTMLESTNSVHAPWTVIDGNNKTTAQLEAIAYILSKVPFRK